MAVTLTSLVKDKARILREHSTYGRKGCRQGQVLPQTPPYVAGRLNAESTAEHLCVHAWDRDKREQRIHALMERAQNGGA